MANFQELDFGTFSNTDDLIDGRDILDLIDGRDILDLIDSAEAGEDLDGVNVAPLLSLFNDIGKDRDSMEEVFIRDTHFQDYAQELAEDLGLTPEASEWPARCIDWEQAARELQQDYSAVELGGMTYWVRSI